VVFKLRYKHCMFAITSACNYRCRWCSIWKIKSKFQSLQKIEEILENLKKGGIKFLGITGGEPTLHPNILDIIKMAKEKKFIVGLNSNGSRPDIIESISEIKIDLIGISLDSHDAKIMDEWRGARGAFKNSVESVKICKEINQAVNVLVLPTTKNSPHLKKTFDFIKNELDVPFSICTPCESKNESWKFDDIDLDKETIASIYLDIIKEFKNYPILTYEKFLEEVVNRFKFGIKKIGCFGGV